MFREHENEFDDLLPIKQACHCALWRGFAVVLLFLIAALGVHVYFGSR